MMTSTSSSNFKKMNMSSSEDEGCIISNASFSTKSSFEESKLSIGERQWMPFSDSINGACSKDESEIFSISSFNSDLDEGSRMKVLYDVEEDVVTVKKVLAEGWLNKKGSGQDFICSRRWKSRWAELAIVKLPHNKMDVPALLMYWHPSNTIPTSFITLHGADVTSNDDGSEDFKHRFKILTMDSYNEDDARIFSTENNQKNVRDEWVHVINIAIRDYHTRLEEGINANPIKMRNSEDSTEAWAEHIQCCSNVKVKYMVATN